MEEALLHLYQLINATKDLFALCDVQAETVYNLEVRSLRSHVAEQEAALKCKEDIIDELRQTVHACGNENNSLRLLFC